MEKIALLPGGFKPPHAGHYNMAKWLAANTDADSVIVKVGSKVRDNISREMALKLFNLYRTSDKDPLANKISILSSDSPSPVRDVYDFIEKEAPEGSKIYLGLGEKDVNDKRYANIGKFAKPKKIKFETILVPPQSGGISGTEMRNFIKNNDKISFYNFLPNHLSNEQKAEAWNVVFSATKEIGLAKDVRAMSKQLEEDLYNPNDKVLDYMKSNDFKRGKTKKDDIPRAYKYKRGGMYTGGGMGFGGMYEEEIKGKTLHVYDFDDTITQVKSNIKTVITKPNDPDFFRMINIPSEKFPEKSKELEGKLKGYDITYDFKEFERQISDAIVNTGVVNKLKKSLGNPQIKTTILTARSIGHPVTRYLKKELGLDVYVVPLGLQVDGKVTGQDKANWIKNYIDKGYKNIYFIDDSKENRDAVSNLQKEYPNIKLKVEDPATVREMMMGMMTEPEKKKHAKNLKRLKKDLKKQGNQYMKVPDYLKGTLTRKYFEELEEIMGNSMYIYDRELSKAELKRRERIAKDLPDNEFKKRYGKDWKSVKLATATKLAKKEGMYPPYKADQVQKVRYQASDTFTNSPKQAKKRGYLEEIGIELSNYKGQILPGDVLRAPKGFPLGSKKLKKSLQLKVIKNSREGVNRYKLSLEDKDGKKYTIRNFQMDGEYQGKKLPKWGLIRKSTKNMNEGDTYEKMAAKGKKAGNLKQGTVRKRLRIKKGEKIPLSRITKAISSLKKRKSLNDKDKKYLKALNLAKTLKTTTNLSSKRENIDPKSQIKHKGKSAPYGSAYKPINEADPKVGTGKKPKGSGRRLYTDENPSDTVSVKFSTRQDIVDTLSKKSFKSKPHKRQSQIINLIHQRVRAALSKAKDPAVKKRLRSGFEYIKKRKEASKRKTQRMKKENVFTKDWWKEIINETLLVEGGAAGHMAHPFNLSNVNSGRDLLDIFEKSADSLDKNPGAVKIDGVNASIRLIDLDGKKQFVMDRGSKKELDVKGITKDDLLKRFGDGHGMVKTGGEVLDLFNSALPSIKSDLIALGAFDDPNILFNMEYVSGKTNVQEYGSNFIAIHGLNRIENKEVQGKRGPLTKRVSSEISYDKSALQSLVNNLIPIAKKKGYEIYGSVPTKMKKKPNFNAALSKTYTVNAGEKSETKSLKQWLDMVDNIPEEDFIFMNVDYEKDSSTVNRKKVGAVSKQVYLAILNGENVDGLFEDAEDRKKAIQGFVTYLATEKLGDEVLKVLDSPMGSVDNHEGVVIRDKNITDVPFKITGKFILGGLATSFR
jgi:hypothetical protein